MSTFNSIASPTYGQKQTFDWFDAVPPEGLNRASHPIQQARKCEALCRSNELEGEAQTETRREKVIFRPVHNIVANV